MSSVRTDWSKREAAACCGWARRPAHGLRETRATAMTTSTGIVTRFNISIQFSAILCRFFIDSLYFQALSADNKSSMKNATSVRADERNGGAVNSSPVHERAQVRMATILLG